VSAIVTKYYWIAHFSGGLNNSVNIYRFVQGREIIGMALGQEVKQ
jgi:hypothetical protein